MLSLQLNCESVRKVLAGFIDNEVRKAGFHRVVVGLSGGVDSSLSAYLAAEALGAANVWGILMPYRTSSPESAAHAAMVVQALGINSLTLSGLIMGGEIFYEVMELIRPAMESRISGTGSGKILLGTVQSDIHDLGKNIVKLLLSCYKLTVYDLGVDVRPEEFLRQAKELQPDILALSGLVTNAYDSMRETIGLFHQEGYQIPIVIGGSQLSKEVFQYTGADYWANMADAGVKLILRLLK